MVQRRDDAVPNETVVSTYDRFATAYDYLTGSFEAGTRRRALAALGVHAGDSVLEVGCGPGHALADLAARVGPRGRVVGLDAAPRMLARARGHVERSGTEDRVGLLCGDARSLPFRDGAFDVGFVEDTLELFSATDADAVLTELARVLSDDGRLGVVTMEREGAGRDPFVRAYDWVYASVPGYDRVGCRPVNARRAVEGAGFTVEHVERRRRWGVWPVEVLIARPPDRGVARNSKERGGARRRYAE